MPNDEYIKRDDVKTAVFAWYVDAMRHGEKKYLDEVIAKIPAADVEPKRKSGRWRIAGAFDDFYQCPECGEMWPIFSTIEWKCCPICECKIITNRPKGEGECLLE